MNRLEIVALEARVVAGPFSLASRVAIPGYTDAGIGWLAVTPIYDLGH